MRQAAPALLALFALVGCSAAIPEGQLVCASAVECPPGWSCIEARCYAEPFDAGADAAEADAGQDAGAISDAGVDAGEMVDAAPDDAGADAGPTDAGPPEELVAVAAGEAHSCALTSDGRVYCWGANAEGQLGDDSTAMRTLAVEVDPRLPRSVEICAGLQHTCARTSEDEIWCWGNNTHGQLGDPGMAMRSDVPVRAVRAGASSLVCGGNFTCAIVDAQVWCWGQNNAGQLGDGTRDPRSVPTRTMGLADATLVSLDAGDGHACVALADGTVRCWGYNSNGQLGDADTPSNLLSSSPLPVGVDGLAEVARVALGAAHSCAIQADGDVICWGNNGSAQLGAPGMDRNVPGDAVTLTGAAAVVAPGGGHTCALGPTLPPTCWGRNNRGQLGTGASTFVDQPPTPVVSVLTGVRGLAAGADHTCAVEPRRVVCWGANASGQLGNATTSDSATPVEVLQTTLRD